MNLCEVILYWRYPPCWPGAHQWRHVCIAFHSSNQTYYIFPNYSLSSLRNQWPSCTRCCMFSLSIAVEQTKFIYNGGSSSRRNLIITLNWHSWQWTIQYHSPKLWLTRLLQVSQKFEQTSEHQFTILSRYFWFLSQIECCNVVCKGILKILISFHDFHVVE